MPLQVLVKIAEASGVSRNTIYSLIDQGKFSLKTTLPVRLEKIRHIVQYFTPINNPNLVTVHSHSMETLSKIEETLNVKTRFYPKCRYRVIPSRGLNNYLTTFFRYTQGPKIQPPLTKEVKHWYEKGIDLKRAIILPCLQSDGSIDRHRLQHIGLGFFGANEILHNFFVDAMYYEYNELPTSYLTDKVYYGKKIFSTVYYKKTITKEIVDEVMNLAGNTKTSPSRNPPQTIEEYLQEPQPHLNYLINASKTEQQIALRIWASAEGFVGIVKKKGLIYPRLTVACAHPVLTKQLQQITRRINIPLHINKSKNYWSGIARLYTDSPSDCIEFLKFGGFIKGVKISSKSKYHEGIDKDILFLGILEAKKRDLKTRRLRKLPIQQIHEEVNKIIENREYKSADYYIDYFS